MRGPGNDARKDGLGMEWPGNKVLTVGSAIPEPIMQLKPTFVHMFIAQNVLHLVTVKYLTSLA